MLDLFRKVSRLLLPITFVKAPVSGRLVPLAAIPDQAFSQGLLGEGVAIAPEEGRVVAPVSGEITKVFPLGHAVSLAAESGISLLVHVGVGVDNVGEDVFRPSVNKGDRVDAGDLLLEFDLALAREQLPLLVVPVIVTNVSGRKKVWPVAGTKVIAGKDNILRITGR
ncbi:MAG: PTS sugar transporter subunit IIA [bacterium]|jgi:glucose-specific phosphotransferase system IIA component